MIGHYPVAGWLRPACSFLKRICGSGPWDEPIPEKAKQFFDEIRQKVQDCDPLHGKWAVKDSQEGKIWVDASSLAIGVVVQIGEDVVEDGSWLRKKNDAAHINLAELEAVLKGLNMAILWDLKKVEIMTDSRTVYSWITTIVTGDRRIRTKGLSETLVRRRLSLIRDMITEFALDFNITWITTHLNLADSLTRVPQKWFKQDVYNIAFVDLQGLTREEILAIHEEHHMGVDKTKYFAKLSYPGKDVENE